MHGYADLISQHGPDVVKDHRYQREDNAQERQISVLSPNSTVNLHVAGSNLVPSSSVATLSITESSLLHDH
ncbi:hypothetical protein EVAR_28799_1 [Eumeta japonica]|uniref:Uncharacterized protein n=1 Tax=Eumeta variegata TaxID=151549 RepID=A0A4C1VFC4_EUMVA|nr:hypothetical protein EVAR_28799_1 [Eumeta japonica]